MARDSLKQRLSRLEARLFTCPQHGTKNLCPACDVFDLSVLSAAELAEACKLLDQIPEPREPSIHGRCTRCGDGMMCLLCVVDHDRRATYDVEAEARRQELWALVELTLRPGVLESLAATYQDHVTRRS